MGHLSYAFASSNRVISAIVLISLLTLSSCSTYLVSAEGDFFQIDDGSNIVYFGICSYKTGNYTEQSEYQSNLLTVFSNLTTAAAVLKTTFYNGTAGSGANKVYAWFYCTDLDACSSCVRNSSDVLLNKCPAKAGVIFDMGGCQVSYYYANISSLLEIANRTSISDCINSDQPKMPDIAVFNRTVVKSMDMLINQVFVEPSIANSSDHFAEDDIPGLYIGQIVHTDVRCLPGLTRLQCKDCLLEGLNQLVAYCLKKGEVSAAIYRLSCRMNYSVLASFGPASSPVVPLPWSPDPSPSMSPNGGSMGWSVHTLWIIVVTIMLQRWICKL